MADHRVNLWCINLKRQWNSPQTVQREDLHLSSFYFITKSVIKIFLSPKGVIETCIENINDNINA